MNRTCIEKLPSYGRTIMRNLEKNGKSQTWLALQCSCSQGNISRIICGNQLPSFVLAHRIAHALDLPTEELFSDLLN